MTHLPVNAEGYIISGRILDSPHRSRQKAARQNQCGRKIMMKDKKEYVEPQVTSYSDEEILAELGEVHAFPPPISRN